LARENMNEISLLIKLIIFNEKMRKGKYVSKIKPVII
jgi:hypothetical protein